MRLEKSVFNVFHTRYGSMVHGNLVSFRMFSSRHQYLTLLWYVRLASDSVLNSFGFVIGPSKIKKQQAKKHTPRNPCRYIVRE